MAVPTGSAVLCGTRRPTSTTLCSTRRPREPPRCTVRAACPREPPCCTVRAARPRHHAAQYAVAAHGSCREAAHDATLGPPWPNRHPKAAPRVQKQKSRHCCNFFAIADCCELPNCGLRRKSAGNRLHDGLFSLCGGRKRVRNRKKVAKTPRFLFSRWVDCPNGLISQWADRRNGANHADVRILVGSIAAGARVTDQTERQPVPCRIGRGWPSGAAARAEGPCGWSVERQRRQQRLGLSIGWSGP